MNNRFHAVVALLAATLFDHAVNAKAPAPRCSSAELSAAEAVAWCFSHPIKCVTGAPRCTPEAPPAPLPPPSPPPPPAAVLERGPYLAFFDWSETTITPDGASILDRVVSNLQSFGAATVAVAGHTDTSEPKDDTPELSERRAAAVKDYLIAKGVMPSAITTHGFGQSRPMVQTEANVREPQNRRVEIMLAPSTPSS